MGRSKLEVVLPLFELVVGHLGVIGDGAVERAAEDSCWLMRWDLSILLLSLGVAGLMQACWMPRSSTCQQNPDRGLGAVVGLDRL